MKTKYPSWTPAYRKAYSAKWRKENAAKIKEQSRLEYIKNRIRYRATARAYYQKNKEKIKAKVQAWKIKNRERCAFRRRSIYYENLAYSRQRARTYAYRRRHTRRAYTYQQYWRARNPGLAARYSAKQHTKEIASLADSYIRGLLKRTYKINNPTPAQIEHRRSIILAKRMSKSFRLLSLATKL